MAAHSVIRQWRLLLLVLGFLLLLLLGVGLLIFAVTGGLGRYAGIIVGLAVFLVLLSASVVVAGALSVTISADADVAGVRSGEVGARWSFSWADVAEVWIVGWRGQHFLAVRPAPTAAAPRSRTSWRSRRMQLPESVRTVRISPESVPAFAQTVQTYVGSPPQPHHSV